MSAGDGERGASAPRSSAVFGVQIFVLGLLTAAVYWVGLSGPFVFDDYNNIVANPMVTLEDGSAASVWRAMLAGDAGPLKRPLSMLSFALNTLATGLDPFYFKLTNLGIHLLNGCLVLYLTRRLLAAGGVADPGGRLALFVTAVWLLHPMQLTSVLYVVQRMTSLSATFVLLGLHAYLNARRPGAGPTARVLWLWLGVPACAAAATLAKENGVLLLLFVLVCESTVQRSPIAPDWRVGTPQQFGAVFVLIPLLALLAFLISTPEWLANGADTRPFNAGERLLTEARVLWLYLRQLVLPAISDLALFYDDFTISRGLREPATTLWAVAGLIVVVAVSTALRRRAPWFAFAVLWFLAAHAMESSFILLELVHPHRNYLAYFGPILALGVAGRAALAQQNVWLSRTVGAAVLAVLAATTALRAYQWRNPLDLAAYEVRHRPLSARAHYEMGRLLHIAAENGGPESLNEEAKRFLWQAAELNPHGVSALVGLGILARGRIPAPVFDALRVRLRRDALAPSDLVYLQALVRCQQRGKCATPVPQIIGIFGAALSQERLRPRVRADVLTLLATYYLQQLGDPPAGVRLMREAAELTPDDPARELNLAQALLFVPDYERARDALDRAQRLDTLRRYRTRLDASRRDLERFVARAGGDEGERAPTP